MIPEYQQSIEDVLKAASPEQLILWQQLRLITGQNAAIRQLYYQGPIAGSEFLTYLNTKLYVCLKLFSTYDVFYTGGGNITLYDQSNAANCKITNQAPFWNITAATTGAAFNAIDIKDFYFSRITNSLYSHMIFIGYRIIY